MKFVRSKKQIKKLQSIFDTSPTAHFSSVDVLSQLEDDSDTNFVIKFQSLTSVLPSIIRLYKPK